VKRIHGAVMLIPALLRAKLAMRIANAELLAMATANNLWLLVEILAIPMIA
jgi:hypothetical protein